MKRKFFIVLVFAFVVFSCFVVFTGLLVRAPGGHYCSVFEAKQYFYEGSTAGEKAIFFKDPFHDGSWNEVEGFERLVYDKERWNENPQDGLFIEGIQVDSKLYYLDDYNSGAEDSLVVRQKLNEVSAICWEKTIQRALFEFCFWIAGLLGLVVIRLLIFRHSSLKV